MERNHYPKNKEATPLNETVLTAQLTHVLSAFAKLSHKETFERKKAYQLAKIAYPFITKDKMPLDIVRLIYDLKLLSRLPSDQKQKLLNVVQEMMQEDGEVTEEEKSLSLLLIRTV